MKNVRLVFFGTLAADSFVRSSLGIESAGKVTLTKSFHLFSASTAASVLTSDVDFLEVQEGFPQNAQQAQDWYAQQDFSKENKTILIPAVFAFAEQSTLETFAKNLVQGEQTFTFKGAPIYIFSASTSQNQFDWKGLEPQVRSLNAPASQLDFTMISSPSRSFNRIDLSGERVKKTCGDPQKGEREWRFLKNLPESVRPFYPTVYEGVLRENHFEYEIERKPTFDLGCFLLYQSLTISEWKTVFQLIHRYLQAVPQESVTTETYRSSLRFLTITKLLFRLEAFHRQPNAARLKKEFHSRSNRSFDECVQELVEALELKFRGLHQTKFYFSHGDLCFSNILFDRERRQIFLIDPRGGFEFENSRAPLEYDLAKLSHSVMGGYDWICAGRPIDPIVSKDIQTEFKTLLAGFSVDPQLVSLMESSLFWSLLPLHEDDGDKLLRFMLAGDQALRKGTGR